jgi:hypothetical protein
MSIYPTRKKTGHVNHILYFCPEGQSEGDHEKALIEEKMKGFYPVP